MPSHSESERAKQGVVANPAGMAGPKAGATGNSGVHKVAKVVPEKPGHGVALGQVAPLKNDATLSMNPVPLKKK